MRDRSKSAIATISRCSTTSENILQKIEDYAIEKSIAKDTNGNNLNSITCPQIRKNCSSLFGNRVNEIMKGKLDLGSKFFIR